MTETLYEMAARMNRDRCSKGCDSNCPEYALHQGYRCLVDRIAQLDNADEQIELMKKWAEEHPRMTYKSVFLDSFPNALLNSKGVPVICRISIFGDSVGNCDYRCAKCWNSEVEE